MFTYLKKIEQNFRTDVLNCIINAEIKVFATKVNYEANPLKKEVLLCILFSSIYFEIIVVFQVGCT